MKDRQDPVDHDGRPSQAPRTVGRSRSSLGWWLIAVGAGTAIVAGAIVGTQVREPGSVAVVGVSAGSPRLRVDRDVIDLGNVPLGEWVEAHFLLTNAGDARWQLTAVPYVRAVAGC